MTVYFQHTPIDFTIGRKQSEKISKPACEILNIHDFLTIVEKHPEGFELTFSNQEEMKELITRLFSLIGAAGGIVLNPDGKLLFIFRRGKWDLPKGKIEEGEDEETCARREIEEETGIGNLTLRKKSIETYHIYPENDRFIFKTSHWFVYNIEKAQEAKPQVEEDITSINWFGINEMNIPFSNTFENIKAVVTAFTDDRP